MVYSFIFNKLIEINNRGLTFLDTLLFYSWENFINKDYVFHFQKNNEFSPITFYWVDIYSLSNPKEITRIHFPKGKEQSEEFKDLCAYKILNQTKMFNTLNFSNNKEINNLMSKIFK